MNIFSNPITGDKFFAREKELNLLDRKVENLKKGYRHNLAILGKMQIGKSSLLLYFLSTLDSADIVPIYLDLSMLSFEGLLDQFIGMLLFNNYKYNNNEIKDDLQSLIDAASSDLPNTQKKIKIIYSYLKTGKERSAFQELLDLPSCFSAESGKFCLIAIDNFRTLETYNLKDAFSILGEKIMLQKMSLYILSDRSNAESKKILSEKLSLLFGKFHIVDLGPFAPQESLTFMDSRCRQLKLSSELKEFLAYFTGGEPFYLDILMESIVAKANQKKISIISEKDLCYIISESIVGRFSPLNLYFTGMVERFSGVGDFKVAIKILNAIVRKNKIADIIEDSRCRREQVHNLLEKFITQDVVVKNGPLYAIEYEIFKIWVRLKETESEVQIRLDKRGYADKFEDGIRQAIEAFKKERQKPIDNKILNLVAAFDNEKVAVNEKTHILPVFKHIRSEYMNSEDFLLSCHGTKLWIFSVFKQLTDENDVLEFINYCKRQKHRVSRKVLIIFEGITPEAKLLAMEEHMWIWPLDKLNSLFNLYRKPKIGWY